MKKPIPPLKITMISPSCIYIYIYIYMKKAIPPLKSHNDFTKNCN